MSKEGKPADLKKKGGDPVVAKGIEPKHLRPEDLAEFRALYNQIGALDEQMLQLEALRNAAERTWLATLRALRAEYGLGKNETFDLNGDVTKIGPEGDYSGK